MDSSGRCTLRNRKFLRKYISEDPYHQPFTMERKTREATNPPQTEDPKDSRPPNDNTVEDTTTKTPDTEDATAEPPETIENIQEKKIPAEQTEESEPRRPCRSRKPPDRLNYSQLGTPGEGGRW